MTDTGKRELDAGDMVAALQAFSGDTQPENGIAEIEQLAQAAIGHRLYTVLVLHRASLQVERIYSSNPDAYPAGGRKDMRDTEWGQIVLERGEPYIGRDSTDIRSHFADHETISALGLASVLNMPIVYDGQVLGAMNLLDREEHYTEADLKPGRLLAIALLPALCMLQTPPPSPA